MREQCLFVRTHDPFPKLEETPMKRSGTTQNKKLMLNKLTITNLNQVRGGRYAISPKTSNDTDDPGCNTDTCVAPVR
jgi:hypothetical protein